MTISLQQDAIKNIIFLYDKKTMIDILKFVKVEIVSNTMVIINLYHNHTIYNYIPIDNPLNHHLVFMCFIEDMEKIFSVLTKDSLIEMHYDGQQLIIKNEGTIFHIGAINAEEFVEVDSITQLPKYSIDIVSDDYDMRNILINSNHHLADYIAFKITNESIYVFNTDNYRIHSVQFENKKHIPSQTLVIPSYFVDYMTKYNFSIHFDDTSDVLLKNKHTIIRIHRKEIIEEFNKAFNYLSFIQQKTYFNRFTINKKLFLEELKKHAIIDKNIAIHIKPNGVILYSQNDNMENHQIKTQSHAYAVELKEHQSILVDIKYLMEFIKSHSQSQITVYTNIKYNLLFSSHNLCATKRM